LPAAAERAIYLDQTSHDFAFGLCERILLQHLNLLDLRNCREIGRTCLVLQERDINSGFGVADALPLKSRAFLATQEDD
jgi:hypothetical protein